jgi:exopolysaccharide biosynthesis polyprenyl glycosylphosphotransferase
MEVASDADQPPGNAAELPAQHLAGQRSLSRNTSVRTLERRIWPLIIVVLLVQDGILLALAGPLAGAVYGCTGPIPLCEIPPAQSGLSYSQVSSDVQILYILLTLLLFVLGGIYTRRHIFHGMKEYQTIFIACGLATLLFEFGRYLVDRHNPAVHSWLLFSWLFGALFVLIGRFAARRALRAARKRGVMVRTALVVGADREGQMLEWRMHQARAAGMRVLGYVDDHRPVGSEVVPGLRVIGAIDDLPTLIDALQIDQVFMAMGDLTDEEALRVLGRVLLTKAELALAPNLFRTLTTGGQLIRVADHAVLQIYKARIQGIDAFLKGTLDIVGATILLILTSPIWLLVRIGLWITAPGPLLVRETFLGEGGRPFQIWKFRTTKGPPPQDDPDRLARRARGLPMRDYPEVTPLGTWLRHYSIDELPQLLNVLARRMSLVGPYKISPDQLPIYQRAYLISPLTMRPGITGVCQIHGRGELTVEERALLDAEYVRTYTIWQDLRILLATIPAVLHGRGAY